ANGRFKITNIPAGSYNLLTSYIGYKTNKTLMELHPGEEKNITIQLDPDVLDYESIVVTGTRKPISKRETSIAITTLNLQEISERRPQNTADAFKAIPGFYVESSGGEGGNNLFSRGMPSDGSYRYISLQEDGFPVFEDCELMFANADIFMRLDETLDHIEGLRGGTGSIYASNAPGGIINFISKVGGAETRGIIKTTVGDYQLFRTDINIGGSLSEKWRYNLGGFYRYDEGIRPTGFPANRGGQIKFNLTRLMKHGTIRLYAKFLDDRNVFYQPIPLQDKDNPRAIPGFDPNYGTLTSSDANYLSLMTPHGEQFVEYLDEGMHPDLKMIGGEINYSVNDRVLVKNAFRYTRINQKFNAIFSLDDPFFATTFADSIVKFENWIYRYTHSQTPITRPEQMNQNGLLIEAGWWSVSMPMFNFANSAEINMKFGKHNLLASYYVSDYSTQPTWFWQNILLDVTNQPKLLDLVDLADNTNFTYNGFSRIGSYHLNFKMDGLVNSIHLVDDYKFSDRLNADVGVRFEKGNYKGYVENNYTENRFDEHGELIIDSRGSPAVFGYDMGDSTTLADDNVIYGDGTVRQFAYTYNQMAFSSGFNFIIDKKLAAFARFSRGFRSPDDQHFVTFAPGSYRLEHINQLEGGLKFASHSFAIFSTLFLSSFQNLPFADEVVDAETGKLIRAFRFADSRTIGLEVEAVAQFNKLGVDLTATIQDPRYLNYEFVGRNEDYTKNRVRRIPGLFFELRPSYSINMFKFFINIRYIGERYTDDANKGILPAYTSYNAGVASEVGNFTFMLTGSNLTNTIGLTEGNPRVDNTLDPNNYFFMARPILGRAFVFSTKYAF
ncbi:MAG: TonB-dependent receptor, partial [Calditrichaeota bacterium]